MLKTVFSARPTDRKGEVRVLTVEQILDEVNYVVVDEGYTLEDFIAEAQDDTLTNARLRELWITFQDWLV